MPPQNCPSRPPPRPTTGAAPPAKPWAAPASSGCLLPSCQDSTNQESSLLVSSLAGTPSGSPVLLVGPWASPVHRPLQPSVSTTPKPLFSPDFSSKSRTHTHMGPLNISGCTQTQPGLCWNLLPPLRHCCTQSPPRTPAGKGAELTPPAPWHALSPMPGAKHSPVSFSVLQSVETALKDKVDQTAQGQGPLGCGQKLFSDPLPLGSHLQPTDPPRRRMGPV